MVGSDLWPAMKKTATICSDSSSSDLHARICKIVSHTMLFTLCRISYLTDYLNDIIAMQLRHMAAAVSFLSRINDDRLAVHVSNLHNFFLRNSVLLQDKQRSSVLTYTCFSGLSKLLYS